MVAPSILISALLLAPAVAPPASEISQPTALSEVERDKVAAASCYALAKTLFDQGDLPGALRYYQRAWRWDPEQQSVVGEIVPLAMSLGQADVGVRYALIQPESLSTEVLRRLALLAAQQKSWPEAAQLFEGWLDKSGAGQTDFALALANLELGRVYLLLSNTDAASRAFEQPTRALLDKPRSPQSRRLAVALGGALPMTLERMLKCHLQAGKPVLAAKLLESLKAMPGQKVKTEYWASRVALARSMPLESFDHLRRYFEKPGDPLGALPYTALRETLVAINETGRYEDELTRLRAGRPHSVYLTLARAELADSSSDTAEARRLYEQIISAASEDSPAQVDQATFVAAGEWLIDDYQANNKPNSLIPLAEKLVASDPTLSMFEGALEAAFTNSDFARQIATRLEVTDSDKPTVLRSLAAGQLSLLAEEYELAVRHFGQAIKDDAKRGPALTLNLAVELLLADQHQLAATALRKAMDQGVIEPDNAAAWYYLGTALALEDDFEPALEATRKAAELSPNSIPFASRPAWVLHRADRAAQAIDAYEAIIEKFDKQKHQPAMRDELRQARMTLSYLYQERGDTRRAVELIQQVLDEFPDEPGALNDLGYLWADRGEHLQRSLRMLQKAVQQSPDNGAYHDSLAWALHRLDRNAEALVEIDKSIQLERQNTPGTNADAEILYHHGAILHALGKLGAAEKAWKQALTQLQDDSERTELADKINEQLEALP